jgi:hypothetical protein
MNHIDQLTVVLTSSTSASSSSSSSSSSSMNEGVNDSKGSGSGDGNGNGNGMSGKLESCVDQQMNINMKMIRAAKLHSSNILQQRFVTTGCPQYTTLVCLRPSVRPSVTHFTMHVMRWCNADDD